MELTPEERAEIQNQIVEYKQQQQPHCQQEVLPQ